MPETPAQSPFHDLAAYVGLPRTTGLVLSRDGSRLVATVATPAADASRYATSLWEIDPSAQRDALRLTRSSEGESAPAFLPDGGLLFLSKRPGPPPTPGETAPAEDVAALWLLPCGGGEARRVAVRAQGLSALTVARDAGTVVVTGPSLPAATDELDDARLARLRREAGVTALLHEQAPVRYWDHDLGPSESRLFVLDLDVPGEGTAPLRELTPAPGRALDEASPKLSPDGSVLVTGWSRPGGGGELLRDLVALDVTDGTRHTLGHATGGTGAVEHASPAVSADGRLAVCVRELGSSWDEIPRTALWLVDLATGDGRELAPLVDLEPAEPVFTADSAAVLFVADERGHRPAFRVEVATGEVTRLTGTGCFSALCPSPDGDHVYALHSGIAAPPAPVRLAPVGADQQPWALRGVGDAPVPPGRVEQVSTQAADGTPLRAWLVLPPGASAQAPAPFLLWIHGGPLGSWNDWSWRWNPHLMAARGWAVLLPDPALSTGYGSAFVRRGWGRWGAEPYEDLIALTDAALERADLDETRTAAMGGSFGGYMANWVATRTDRFRAIVTHASLWALDQFVPTTDHPAYWRKEFGSATERPERYDAWSPHRYADRISTPMLVVHGDRDYRVPVGEGLRLWADLQRLGVPSRFLYFPDENHWVLKPGNARVWYETAFAFLDHHVLDKPWVRPQLL